MTWNTFGRWFRFTTFGESHGPAIGVVVDGVPSRVPLDEAIIQPYLDQRKPGTSRFVTQRREADSVRILSGVFEGLTTGTPIALLINNEDQRSKDYSDIAQVYRPGHADITYAMKYGIRDPRGGGRSSARETAMRVAAGAVAQQVLRHCLGGLVIRGGLVSVGGIAVDRSRLDWALVEDNPFWCPDSQVLPQWQNAVDNARRDGDSLGAVVEIHALGVPAGLGSPVYGKLDADLAAAMMSINAVKGVEIGDGFAAADSRGSHSNDDISYEDGQVRFASNSAGGILGGISNGDTIIVRLAIKPTSSIRQPQKTITTSGALHHIATHGRHDPCVGMRAVPVAQAMMATVVLDQWLAHRAQNGHGGHAGYSAVNFAPSSDGDQ